MVSVNSKYRQSNIEVRILIVHMTKPAEQASITHSNSIPNNLHIHRTSIHLECVWISVSKNDFAKLSLVKIDFEVVRYRFGCFYFYYKNLV